MIIERSITREAINALEIRSWKGPVLLAESAEDLARALADIESDTVVGFDTETRPSFRPGESHPPALAQIATARAVHLWPLLRLDCSAALARLLGEARIVKAGVGLADDLRKLRETFPFEARSVADLGIAAKRHGVEKTGVRGLAALFLGFRIPKGTKTSNWAAPRLSPQQIAYAATDAWACRELWLRFRELKLL
jgi:ribonuclease D